MVQEFFVVRTSEGQRRGRVWLAVLVFVDGLALFEGVRAKVATSFSQFVGLLGQDSADRADYGFPVGKTPTESVRQRISWLRRS